MKVPKKIVKLVDIAYEKHQEYLKQYDILGAAFDDKDNLKIENMTKNMNFGDLDFIKLDGRNLRHANLSRGSFMHASFVGADLRNADFTWTSLNGADFTGANVAGAVFSNAHIEGTNFKGSNINPLQLEQSTGIPIWDVVDEEQQSQE